MTGSPGEPIDTSRPHPARRYNYWLGGKDNFAADRASGDEYERKAPYIRLSALENRKFLGRAVRFLAAEAGIRQFLDIGTGLPTADNTHEVAQRIAPESRVVYVDNDPLVLSHARALLNSSPEGRTTYIHADLHDPAAILDDAQLTGTLDLSKPVGLTLIAVLHFIRGDNAANPLVDQLLAALPAGSYIAATHGTLDFADEETRAWFEQMQRSGKLDSWTRGRAEFASLFRGLHLLEPGIVPVSEWHPDPDAVIPDPQKVGILGAVARKD